MSFHAQRCRVQAPHLASSETCRFADHQLHSQDAASPQQSPDNVWQGVFIAAGSFDGPRPGYIYKHGDQGLGYYQDVHNPGDTAYCQPSCDH